MNDIALKLSKAIQLSTKFGSYNIALEAFKIDTGKVIINIVFASVFKREYQSTDHETRQDYAHCSGALSE